MTDEDDVMEYGDEREAHRNRQRIMGEYNPDEWDPDERPQAGIVNIMDPVLGEPVNVDGHPHDRPSDMDADHARRLALNGEFDDLVDDDPLPLLSSSMRTDPVEGTQGSFSKVTREDCPKCPSEYGVYQQAHTLAGVARVSCLLCDYEIHSP
jgi:hypothetical protein